MTLLRLTRLLGTLVGRIAGIIGMASVVVTFLLLIADVLFRYVLQVSAPWIGEFARLTYICIVLFGSCWCISHGEHIKVEFIYERLSPKAHAVARIIICLAIGFFLYGVFRGSVPVISTHMDTFMSGIPFLRLGYAYSLVPVSIVLMWLSLIGEIAASVISFMEAAQQKEPGNGSA